MTTKTLGTASLAAAMALAVLAPSASAVTGDGAAPDAAKPEDMISDTEYYVSNGFTQTVAVSSQVPRVLGEVAVGQWGAGGEDRVGSVNPETGLVQFAPDATRGEPTALAPAIKRPAEGGTAIVGDWCGTGDVVGYVTGVSFHLGCTAGAAAEVEFTFGRAGDEILVGDWDGDGHDTIAVRRGNHYFLNNDLEAGPADTDFTFGRSTDQSVAGDWDGEGRDTIAVRRGNSFFADGGAGNTAMTTTFGRYSDVPFAVDVDADGTDELGVRRDPSLSWHVDRTLLRLEMEADADARAVSARTGSTVLPAWPSTRDRLGVEYRYGTDEQGVFVRVVAQYADPAYVDAPVLLLRPSAHVGDWETVSVQGPAVA